MEEFAPGELLSQAALQMSESFMAEVRTAVKNDEITDRDLLFDFYRFQRTVEGTPLEIWYCSVF